MDNYPPSQRTYVHHVYTSEFDGSYLLDVEAKNGYVEIRLPSGERGVVLAANLARVDPPEPVMPPTFRYKDSSSVPDAPEWLNNICNRIDALEATVEVIEDLELETAMHRAIATYDFRNIVQSVIETPEFAHMVRNLVRQAAIEQRPKGWR